MIQLDKIGIQFGEKVLFEDVSITLATGNRYGVVGANGSGKTTFLKLLSGELLPTAGEIRKPSALKIGVLKQNQYEYENNSILDVVLMGKPQLWSLLQEKHKLDQKSHLTMEEGQHLAELEHKFGELNGYNVEGRAAIILNGLGIRQEQIRNPMSTLSGGYKLRVLLGQCLFGEPDILILDEPNNHLDLYSIAWLAEYLKEFKGIVVVVSHDQYFLNQISTHILDIDYETIKLYKGDCNRFLTDKQLESARKKVEIERLEKKQQELQAFYERFRAKATKARQAVSRKKQIDKMDEIVIIRSSRKMPKFQFVQQRTSGQQVLEVKGLSKSFGELEVLKNISFNVERGDRVAVIGPNGVGKSTLIKILAGLVPIDVGYLNWGYECHVGYFAQNHKDMIPAGTTVYDWLYSFTPNEKVTTIRSILGQVLFSGDDSLKSTDILSGGEGARLILARLMIEQHNILLLDEPTNYLDLEAIEALEKGLKQFSGTVIFVSHNRHFVNNIATAILELTFDGFTFYPGNYVDYLAREQQDYLNRDIQVRVKQSQTGKRSNAGNNQKQLISERRNIFRELSRLQKKIDRSELSISEIENKIKDIENKFSDPAIFNEARQKEFQELYREQQKLRNTLQQGYELWENDHYRLEELQQRIREIDQLGR